MAEYIAREDIFPNGVFFVSLEHPEKSLDELINRIRGLPAADVVEVRHGSWKRLPFGMFFCSECRELQKKRRFLPNYCHQCGAKMDGKGEG